MRLKTTEWCFIAGLLFYTVGQFLIFVVYNDLEVLHAQEPIDFAHWGMLIGVLLLLPHISNTPKNVLSLLGAPVLILGIGLIIGMCVDDFVFWSIDDAQLKRQVADILINTPSIWVPFMTVNGSVFNVGLLLLSAGYLSRSRLGVAVIFISTLIVYMGGGWLNVLGYSILTGGFFISFYHCAKRMTNPV